VKEDDGDESWIVALVLYILGAIGCGLWQHSIGLGVFALALLLAIERIDL
jgi:hypothetical protein